MYVYIVKILTDISCLTNNKLYFQLLMFILFSIVGLRISHYLKFMLDFLSSILILFVFFILGKIVRFSLYLGHSNRSFIYSSKFFRANSEFEDN